MPDDDRPRRRLGDETKERIADLASGWSLDGNEEVPPRAPAAKPAHTPTPKPKAAAPAPALKPASPAATPKPIAPPADASAPNRSKPRTNPPPPPGSAERKALEDKIIETARPARPGVKTSTSANPVAGEARGKPLTTPPPAKSGPIDTTRGKPPTMPPPAKSGPIDTRGGGPQFKRADYAGPGSPLATSARTPPVIVDNALDAITFDTDTFTPLPPAPEPSKPIALPLPPRPPTPPPAAGISNSKLAVPIGEFDSGVQTIEQDTAKREAAEAVLRIPSKITPVEDLLEDEDDERPPERGDATTIDPLTAKFERGDPTSLGGPDATEIQGPSHRISQHSGATLRPSAALRRKRGIYGDVRYVFTALFGVRASRRELAALEHRQGLRQISRRRHLVTLGRTAVITDSLDHPALGKAREEMQAIEDERSRHAGAVSAADAELERVRRDRDTKAKKYVADIAATDGELAELAKKLAPLEKEATVARKRGQELREQMQRVTKKIADTEALLNSVKAETMDKAQILADIATLKADKQSVMRDEPALAATLDALNPRIAAIEGARNELRRKRSELEKAEQEDLRRTAELLEAIGAKRKVVERAASDAETARDNAFFSLGERLYVDRPKVLAAQLSPIDQIDLELGEGDRRTMELKEILSNIDKWKFARGMGMALLVLGVVSLFVGWLLVALL